MLSFLGTILILSGIVIILWWASEALGLSEPVRIVSVTVLAIVMLWTLWTLLLAPGPRWHGLGPY